MCLKICCEDTVLSKYETAKTPANSPNMKPKGPLSTPSITRIDTGQDAHTAMVIATVVRALRDEERSEARTNALIRHLPQPMDITNAAS